MTIGRIVFEQALIRIAHLESELKETHEALRKQDIAMTELNIRLIRAERAILNGIGGTV